MAYTIVDVVRFRLDKSIAYAVNPAKTCIGKDGTVSATYEQAENDPSITMYATALNCQSVAGAYSDMSATKARYGKKDKVQGFTFIQSFPSGVVTPEQAHAIGVEFARRCFGERFEVVIGTHLNTETLHNHIVINSVSFADGLKYRSNKSSYFKRVLAISEDVCKSYELPPAERFQGREKGKHYAEWMAEKEGKPTKRGILQADIDEAIRQSYTFPTFLEYLKKCGHTVNANPNHKYITVRPRGGERFFRLTQKSMGTGYSEDDIKRRLARQRDGLPEEPRAAPSTKAKPRARYSDAAAYRPRPHRKLKGFVGLYHHYLYFLKVVKHGGKSNRLPFSIRQDVTKLEKITRQFLYLYRNNITTSEELQTHRQGLEDKITERARQREALYRERRNAASDSEIAALSGQINEKTAALRELRKAWRICDSIKVEAPAVDAKIRQAEAETDKEKLGIVQEREKKKDTFYLH